MIKGLFVSAGVAGSLAFASAAQAYVIDDVVVEYWAGSGANEALMVVDFGPQSYAFGYRWDGQATSWDLLETVTGAGAFDITYTEYDFGNAIDSLSYDGYTLASDWTNTFAGYWGSTDGEAWTPLDVGVSDRTLTHGVWDGWSLESVAAGFDPLNAPDVPLVPEPASLAMLALGGLALVRRGRRIA